MAGGAPARGLRGLLLAAFALAASPALAQTAEPSVGLRALGSDADSARTVGPGRWVAEAGVWVPVFADPGLSGQADAEVFERWRLLPAWPQARGLYGLASGDEVAIQLGPEVGGGYRRLFLTAEAPWGGEYLQALIQLGGGFNVVAFKPYGYLRAPAIYERGPLTFHVAPGGYYAFNQQPMVDVQAGVEARPWPALQLGASLRARMDAQRVTPLEAGYGYGGGVRYRLGPWLLQAELNQDPGPPVYGDNPPQPRIEFPFTAFRAGVAYGF